MLSDILFFTYAWQHCTARGMTICWWMSCTDFLLYKTWIGDVCLYDIIKIILFVWVIQFL